jgi:hypothetical protein
MVDVENEYYLEGTWKCDNQAMDVWEKFESVTKYTLFDSMVECG